MSIPLRSQL